MPQKKHARKVSLQMGQIVKTKTGDIRQKTIRSYCFVVSLIVCRGCTGSEAKKKKVESGPPPEISFQPLKSPSEQTGEPMFTQLDGRQTGLKMINELKPENMRKYLLNGAGICTGDYDNDGLVDVFAVSQDGKNRLYRQTEPWKFFDVTGSAGDLSGELYWGTGASFADVNNDGFLDLYVCNINGPNQLFINQQNGSFEEDAAQRNVDYSGASNMASFANYDQDGDLDLYLLNNRVFSIAEESPNLKMRLVNGRKVVHPDYRDQYFLLEDRLQEASQRDILFQNDGGGNFRDITCES